MTVLPSTKRFSVTLPSDNSLSLYNRYILSFATFNLRAICFFNSSMLSLFLIFTSKGPPVNGATVIQILVTLLGVGGLHCAAFVVCAFVDGKGGQRTTPPAAPS